MKKRLHDTTSRFGVNDMEAATATNGKITSKSGKSRSRPIKSTTMTMHNVAVAGLSVSLLIATVCTWILVDHEVAATAATTTAMKDYHDVHRILQDPIEDDIADQGESGVVSSIAVNVTFEDILKTIVFLIVTWGAANACRVIGLPSLAGEIVAGMILGPPVLDFCPYPEAMVLIGNFGLLGLILSSGIDLDIAQLRETGTRAVMIAVSGTTLALSTGIGVSYLVDINRIQEAFSIGAIFAPSSWGVASQVLSKGGILNTPTGQTIMASSVVDDILGLILLSILEVFVMTNPTVFDYIKPFLASFGYLILLGGLGITVVPRLIENHILPKIPEHKQDFVAIALMFCLMTAYLPLMYYSGASFLTGAFLAGVSFSQLNHVHATFASSSREVMVWLMRIFFAATIGFQVPATYFKDPPVLSMGAVFLVPILAKFPLGFLIPRFQREIPADFPYDPYWRDMWITALSMLCRGEFNFVVASLALQTGLLTSEHYAGTVFAVLISAVVGPLVLSRVIAYYNQKSIDYLDASHPIKRIGTTGDGYRPLFLAIQARTPVHWGMHDKLKQTLEEAGLIIIDHRSWHSMGMNAVNVTEIFCQDKEIQVKIRGCFAAESERESTRSHRARRTEAGSSRKSGRLSKTPTPVSLAETFTSSEGQVETGPDEDFMVLVAERKAEIEEIIATALDLDPSEYAIQVSEWQTFPFEQQRDRERALPAKGNIEKGYSFHSSSPNDEDYRETTGKVPEIVEALKSPGWKPSFARPKTNVSSEETSQGETPKPKLSRGTSNDSFTGEEKGHRPTPSRGHRRNNTGVSLTGSISHVAEDPVLTDPDLWDTDEGCHDLARQGYYQTPTCDGTNTVHIEEGLESNVGGHRHRRTSSFSFVDTHGNAGNRSRVDSRSSSHCVDTNDNEGNRSRVNSRCSFFLPDDEGEDEENPSPPSVALDDGLDGVALIDRISNIPRPNRMYKRSVTFDVSQLAPTNDLHELESGKIKERLHGYVRQL